MHPTVQNSSSASRHHSAITWFLLAAFVLTFVGFRFARATSVFADNAAQTVPFTQNWANIGLITVNDNWAAVPGVTGYRGDDLTTATGVDPQTILADGSATPQNVIANQTNPNTLISGGIADFEIADPVVALQGSGTADVPHLVVNLNTTGQTGVAVSYNLRDVDGSADNAVQPVALQYRVGASGNYTNLPAAFVADASTGPNLATQITPVNIVLPAACDNQPLVQLRILTTNAIGSDEWIGVDNLQVGTGGAVPLSATGSAAPAQINAGESVLLTVAVTPATNPASTNITVTSNLAAIGGADQPQPFFDDGTNGDQTAGDNIFSFLFTVPTSAAGGARSLAVLAADTQNRTANTTISLTVRGAVNPLVHLTMGNPTNATADVAQPFNYLLLKNQYALSYHRDNGRANWVSWHLDRTWLGSAPRQDDFRPDPSLPEGWYRVTQFDYSGSGFDRGHHTPSADRTATIEDNSATFFMTNMMPQAPDNNQGPWEQLESYCRTLVNQNNELYIVMGGAGQGGVGSNGAATTVANGRVSVPAQTWKVIMVLPQGDDDLSRVHKQIRTIAVVMPNQQGIRNNDWRGYRTSIDRVEQLTGYDFFSNVAPVVERAIERRIDEQP